MSSRIAIHLRNGDTLFYLEQLAEKTPLGNFSCSIAEYNDYLIEDSLRSQNDHIALTWLLRERKDGTIIAYIKTLPAMKIGKLAVCEFAQKKYKGIGSYMIDNALALARACNRQLFACRFIVTLM